MGQCHLLRPTLPVARRVLESGSVVSRCEITSSPANHRIESPELVSVTTRHPVSSTFTAVRVWLDSWTARPVSVWGLVVFMNAIFAAVATFVHVQKTEIRT